MKNENNGTKKRVYKILSILFTIGLIACLGMMACNSKSEQDAEDKFNWWMDTYPKSDSFNNDFEKNLEKALVCDSLGTLFGSFFGTSNLTTYVESTVGIEAGGRTGLTAVSAALCFACTIFIAPIVACVPMAAIAPILMFVGVSMMQSILKIDWNDIIVAIPAFFTIIMMTLSYSITTGIQFGFIFYIIVNLANKQPKKVSPIIYIFTILFIIDFIYKAIG